MIIFTRFLADRRRATLWWLAGIVALIAFTAAFWPTVRGQVSFDQVLDDMPEAMRTMFGIDTAVSISSAPGYLQGRVFATLLPVLLIINAIGLGAAALAGSEHDGTLELILANPLSRRRLFAERGLAALAMLTIPAIAAGISIAVLGAPMGLLDGVSLSGLAGATAAAFALALLFGALAFAIGAATGRRNLAVSIPAGLAVATYLLQGLLSAANAPAVALDLTPWHWYLEHNMLIEGVAPGALALPLLIGAGAIAMAAPRFGHRDLT
jgi:ABC-2 type transport system permease protein